jgi:hypothetical protein
MSAFLLTTRILLLLLLVVVPGAIVTLICVYYLGPEWQALEQSYQDFQAIANAGSSSTALYIARAAEDRHRINCFAEGVGALLGLVIVAIGIHGICLLPGSGRN